MARYFEKAKTSVTIERRNKVIPCTALVCIKAATIRPAASYSRLFKSSTLKRGLEQLVEHLHTFTYIFHEIGDEISRQDTPMRKAVIPNRRLL